jgi:LPPG:FO 2-phospho-L-lactate transferase
MNLKVVALAGGVGGAKLVDGLANLLTPEEFCVIVNTGDDFDHLGLRICPDLDTVCYTLANLANPVTGWGRRDESWVVFDTLAKLGGPDWFRLGDQDLATHLFRTSLLNEGYSLYKVTQMLCEKWGVNHSVFPMSNDAVQTIVHTSDGESLAFQEYFVRQGFQPAVESIEFTGAKESKPNAKAINCLAGADLVVIAPSNPWVSIDPILAVPGYRKLINQKPVIAVSPLIGGKAVKGPAAKMFQEMGIEPTASAVASHYREILTGFMLDTSDHAEFEIISRWRIIPYEDNILMNNKKDRVRLAEAVLNFGETILTRSR